MPAVLMLSLFAGGLAAAHLIGRRHASSASSVRPPSAKASVERQLMSLIISAPARKLPRRFVDTTTGLVKNNVQVDCHNGIQRTFLCVVQLANHAPRIYVGYRRKRGGGGVFTWYSHKPRLRG